MAPERLHNYLKTKIRNIYTKIPWYPSLWV